MDGWQGDLAGIIIIFDTHLENTIATTMLCGEQCRTPYRLHEGTDGLTQKDEKASTY